MIVTYIGMYMAQGQAPDVSLTLFTLIGVGLASGASSVLNNYIDRGIDGVMERTKARSLPTGRVLPQQALILGVVCGVISFLLLAWKVNLLTACLSAGALLAYIFVYTIWLKRTTEHNTVIGGAAGALPPVMGIAAVNNDIGMTAIVLFVVLFVWQPPHFWALALIRAEEYRAAGIPMLPVVRGQDYTKRQMLYYTIALVPASALPYLFNICGGIYLIGALALGFVYLGWTISFVRRPFNPIESRRLFLFSILYITAVYGLMFADCKTIPTNIASEYFLESDHVSF